MNDQELTEAAALAAGLTLGSWDEDREEWNYQFRSLLTEGHFWAPLIDDGDAMRLAVARKIFRCHMDLFHRFYDEEMAAGRTDLEATRRAITRAAICCNKPRGQEGGAA